MDFSKGHAFGKSGFLGYKESMRSLEGLNPKQAEAVQLVDQNLLVVAGAGSGKTRVLTHKIGYLIEECHIPPHQILAMTFSNKAAFEMKQRVQHLLPMFEQPQWIGTFHAICLRLLKEFHLEAGLKENFTIYDESDQLSAIKRALKDLNIDPKRIPPKNIRYHIDQAKNQTDQVIPFLVQEKNLSEEMVKIIERYQILLNQNQALDFGDLLIRTTRLLKTNPSVANLLHQRFKRILVDEYQDTNHIQKILLQLLRGNEGLVCAVGDEDQSIYGWRGARIENMLDFPQDFPPATIVTLEQNYRSTKKILGAANHVIHNNFGRRSKNLWTENEEGSAVLFFQAEEDRQEASFVLDQIQTLVQEKKTAMKDIAIFYRTHVQSRVLEEECRHRNQPYRVFGGVRFFDRAEIKDALAYLKLALNPSDNISFERIINSPPRGVGPKTLSHLFEISQTQGISLLESIPWLKTQGKNSKNLQDFFSWITQLQTQIQLLPVDQFLEKLLTESGYFESLQKEDTVESDSRLENLEELLRSVKEFSQEHDSNAQAYLEHVSLLSEMDRKDSTAEALTMMTVHNAKGLEFDAVFLVGMEERVFPHIRALEDGDPNELEEERRLCYVAMTRAKKNLWLSASSRRFLYRNTQWNPISRFIGEIPSTFLVQMDNLSLFSPFSFSAKKIRPPKRKVENEFFQESYEEDSFLSSRERNRISQPHSPYQPGLQIFHPSFGEGTIRKCEGDPNNLKLTVQFKKSGLKKILLNYCQVEVIH